MRCVSGIWQLTLKPASAILSLLQVLCAFWSSGRKVLTVDFLLCRMGTRCYWDQGTDNSASATFSNDSMFCTCVAFGIYLY